MPQAYNQQVGGAPAAVERALPLLEERTFMVQRNIFHFLDLAAFLVAIRHSH